MSSQIFTVSESDQSQVLPIIVIPVQPEQKTVMGPVFPRPPLITIKKPGPLQPERNVVIRIPTPNLEERTRNMVVAFLRSPEAHSLTQPVLPSDDILKTWREKKWRCVREWMELHAIGCKNMAAGDPIPSITFSLPTSIRRCMFAQMGFGDVPRSRGGLKLSYLEDVLKAHFPNHDPLVNTCGDWCSMIYVFFHVKTGKLYVGSYSRENWNGLAWVERTREHFNDSIKKIGKKERSCPELHLVIRTSVLSDWKIFALKRIPYVSPVSRYELEGWWIRTLKSVKHGFNGSVPAYHKDPVVSEHPVLKNMYIRNVNEALKIHRRILQNHTAPSRHIDAAVQNVTTAIYSLQVELYQLGPEYLQPIH